MTATGAEAGNDPAPGGPTVSVATGISRGVAVTRPAPIRAVVSIVLALLAALAAWLLLQHGIRTDDFPSFIAGESSTPITRYSGPWLTAAAAVALVAGLLLMVAAFDLVRWSQAGKSRVG